MNAITYNTTEPSGHQRYRCKNCGKRFREPGDFQESRRFPIQQVGAALQWYFDGLSYREVARNLGRTFRTDPPDTAAVYEWVQGYSRGAMDAIKDIKVEAGKEWVADEIRVNVGGKPYWLWNVIDRRSRFLLATRLTPNRNARAAAIVMEKAKAAAVKPSEVIRTDRRRRDRPVAWTHDFQRQGTPARGRSRDGVSHAAAHSAPRRLAGGMIGREAEARR